MFREFLQELLGFLNNYYGSLGLSTSRKASSTDIGAWRVETLRASAQEIHSRNPSTRRSALGSRPQSHPCSYPFGENQERIRLPVEIIGLPGFAFALPIGDVLAWVLHKGNLMKSVGGWNRIKQTC